MLDDVNRKLLKIIGGIIIVVLIVLLIIISFNAKKNVLKVNNNYSKVVNNNSNIIHYDNKIFFMDNSVVNGRNYYKFVYLPINFESGDVNPAILKDFGNVEPSKKLFIDKYFLFYYFSGKTYYYNLNTYDNDVFCEGELQYLDSENHSYFSLYNGNIYRGTYYEDTLSTRQINKLTTSAMNRVYEDEDTLYYYVTMQNGVLLGLSKDKSTLSTYDSYDSSTSRIEDVFSTDKYVFVVISRNDGKTLDRVTKQTKEIQHYDLGNDYYNVTIAKNSNTGKKKSNDIYLYANGYKGETKIMYSESLNSVKEYNDVVPGDSIQNYSVKIDEDNIITLYKNKKKITTIACPMSNVENINLTNIEIIGDYLYYDISMNNIKNIVETEDSSNDAETEVTPSNTQIITCSILARTNVNGGESYQMNLK